MMNIRDLRCKQIEKRALFGCDLKYSSDAHMSDLAGPLISLYVDS